jgi:hypothetical protein
MVTVTVAAAAIVGGDIIVMSMFGLAVLLKPTKIVEPEAATTDLILPEAEDHTRSREKVCPAATVYVNVTEAPAANATEVW